MACLTFSSLAFEWGFAFVTDFARSLRDWAFDVSSCSRRRRFFGCRLLFRGGEFGTFLASPMATVEADVVYTILGLATMACAVYSDTNWLLDPVDVTFDRRFPFANLKLQAVLRKQDASFFLLNLRILSSGLGRLWSDRNFGWFLIRWLVIGQLRRLGRFNR